MTAPRLSAVLPAVLALPLIPLLLAQFLFVPVYRTNDDVGMNLVAAGVGFVTGPSPLLLFSHVFLGRLLNFLNTLAPGAPWYYFVGVAAQYASGVAIAFAALHRRISATRVLLVLFYFLGFGALFHAQPHFTIISSSCAIGAYLLWLDRTGNDETFGPGTWTAFLALWIAAALFRYHSAGLMFILTLPALVGLGARVLNPALRPLRSSRSIVIPLIVSGLLIAALTWYDRYQYFSDPEWDDFNSTAGPTGDLVDFGRGSLNPVQRWARDARGNPVAVERRYDPLAYSIAADQAGWSPNDYGMAMEWFFADPVVFSAENLRGVADALPPPIFGELESLKQMRHAVHLPYLLAVTLLPLLLVAWRGPFGIEVGLALVGVLIVGTGLVVFLDRLPSWVYEPMLALVCAHATLRAEHTPLIRRDLTIPSWIPLLALAAILIPLPTAGLRLYRSSEYAVAMNDGLRSALADLRSEPDLLHVVWGSALPYEWFLPLNDPREFAGLRFYSVGGDTRGPNNRRQLEHFGIQDIHRAIYDHPAVRVISDDRLNLLMVRFVAEHHGVQIVPVATSSHGTEASHLFTVYRFVRRAPAAAPPELQLEKD